MGKYDDVLKNLLRIPDKNNDRKQVINDIQESFIKTNGSLITHIVPSCEAYTPEGFGCESLNDVSIEELARSYKSLRHHKEMLEDSISQINLLIEAISDLVEKKYEQSGVTSVKLKDGGSLSSQPEPVAVVEDPAVFREWCLENNLGKSLSLHPSTLQALVKQRLLEGEDVPAGVRAYFRPKLVLRS